MTKKATDFSQDLTTDIQEQLAALAQQAREGLAALDARIAELRRRHDAMTRNAVSAAAAAARIVADVRASIADDVKRMQHVATAAVHLKAHAEYRQIVAITGDGRHEVAPLSAPGPLGIMDRLSPAVLFSVLDPTGEKLHAWAVDVAKAAGCPDMAPPVEQTARTADALMTEIEALMEQRLSASKALDSLLGESAQARDVAEVVRRMNSSPQGRPDDAPPRVGVFDATGNPVDVIGAHDPYAAVMAHRHQAEALERAAQVGTPEGDIAALNEADDRALRAMTH